MKFTGEMQKVRFGVAVHYSQERIHTFHQILKGAHDAPQNNGVKYISWFFLH